MRLTRQFATWTPRTVEGCTTQGKEYEIDGIVLGRPAAGLASYSFINDSGEDDLAAESLFGPIRVEYTLFGKFRAWLDAKFPNNYWALKQRLAGKESDIKNMQESFRKMVDARDIWYKSATKNIGEISELKETNAKLIAALLKLKKTTAKRKKAA